MKSLSSDAIANGAILANNIIFGFNLIELCFFMASERTTKNMIIVTKNLQPS